MGTQDGNEEQPLSPQFTRSLIQDIYRELKAVAANKLRGFPRDESLSPTELVSEVYVRFTQELGEDASWENRRHFLNASARKMNQILIDRARRRGAERHGGQHRRVEMEDECLADGLPSTDWSSLKDALELLEQADSQAATVLRWHFLLQFSLGDIAEALEISLSTVDRARRRGLRKLRETLSSNFSG